MASLGLAVSAFLALGRQGDVSIRDSCHGATVRAYFHPQDATPPPPDGISDVNIGRLCNEDASKRMHEVFVLLPTGLVAGLAGVALLVRQDRRRAAHIHR